MPDDNFHTPGQLIEELLKQFGWSKRVLAIILGTDETGLNAMIAGKRPLNAKIALGLADVFGEPAERFMALQKKYDLAQARIVERSDPGRSMRAHLFGGLPVSEMAKRGWLPGVKDVRDVPTTQAALTKFFKASSLEEIEILPHAAKKTKVSPDVTPVQLAWLYRVLEIADEMLVSKYSPAAVESTIEKLKTLRSSPDGISKVPRLLSDCGIRFIIVEALPGSEIDGVCTWLNDRSPVIAMSLRYDRIDNFWFVLRHECEHVIQCHGQSQIMLDTALEGEKAGDGPSVAEEERVANIAAAEFCVPKKMMDQFIARKAPFFAERDLLGFANILKVHPGLVAGQLQHRTKRYDRFRGHLAKVRAIICPTALVDGWGDVVPVGND